MKTLFKNFDIDITILDGYNDAHGLNKINNCIKHSAEISQDVKSIKEFEKSTELEFENLRVFHNRIRVKIEDFSKALGQAIINDLYLFDDERLGNICMSYVNRMKKETAKKFIEIFISKLKEKSEEEKVLELIKAYQNL